MATASSVFRAFDDYNDNYSNNDDLCTKSFDFPASAAAKKGVLDRRKNILFTPKFQYSTKNNPLCGICLPEWLSILRQRGHQIEWTVYWPRLVFISLLSVVNSLLGLLDIVSDGNDLAAESACFGQ
jgi:hypothetical protein